MGSNRSHNNIIWVVFFLSFFSFVHGSNDYNSDSLDILIHNYAQKALAKHHTGILYNVSLPSNFSGMEVSAIGLRSESFWTRGANFSGVQIPPRIIPMPYVKRLAIVYEKLGNWSSYYYKVPGFTLVTPVIGFMVYDATDLSAIGGKKLQLSIEGDPISVQFPHLAALERQDMTRKCVEFGDGGLVKMSNMTSPNACFARSQGHFSIAVPTPLAVAKKGRLWRWWVIGFGGGLVGLALVGLVGVLIFKMVRRKKIKDMEKESEKSVAFDSIWIGRSKMPSATAIRTQPALENEYVP